MRQFKKSSKLDDVCYEIRGAAMAESARLEEEGHRIVKLNIGNPAPFGFEAPEEILVDVIHNLPTAQGYCDSKGLYSARKAVMQYCQQLDIQNVTVDDVYIGNGVSELIVMSMQGLINNGDEILVPAPDYPLWTAAITLAGGKAVHYLCDEQSGWTPDIADMRRKLTSRTRGIVIINPNNPTGAVYPRALLEDVVKLAQERDLILLADEIYDKILYDDAKHVAIASLAPDLLALTFNGLSKTYRVAGFRTGWMVVSGAKHRATEFIQGLDILSTMRLCANVPAQHAIQGALGGKQSIDAFLRPGGRLYEQRNLAYEMLNTIDGVSCVKPKAALYFFPKLDKRKFNITNDEQFALDLLRREKILVVHGTGFNWPEPDHFRMVFLPRDEELKDAITRIGNFLSTYRQ
ncbi:MAG: aminotransferase [Candidatus Muproteobacteria bacterium RBG_16_60_9]|uniref:Glutamate-pyruvate aminotransferase AlaA n=1 Tax=Candidatus Muproteobacteria bacterium RBG_16_60_9 TaxID=1817755 RepID=A0A1F6VGQ1_9PROT|nr:MAG: aminotransferase [Candidatus Muproteobacteria bacterium RBG_16_60_9]